MNWNVNLKEKQVLESWKFKTMKSVKWEIQTLASDRKTSRQTWNMLKTGVVETVEYPEC